MAGNENFPPYCPQDFQWSSLFDTYVKSVKTYVGLDTPCWCRRALPPLMRPPQAWEPAVGWHQQWHHSCALFFICGWQSLSWRQPGHSCGFCGTHLWGGILKEGRSCHLRMRSWTGRIRTLHPFMNIQSLKTGKGLMHKRTGKPYCHFPTPRLGKSFIQFSSLATAYEAKLLFEILFSSNQFKNLWFKFTLYLYTQMFMLYPYKHRQIYSSGFFKTIRP